MRGWPRRGTRAPRSRWAGPVGQVHAGTTPHTGRALAPAASHDPVFVDRPAPKVSMESQPQNTCRVGKAYFRNTVAGDMPVQMVRTSKEDGVREP